MKIRDVMTKDPITISVDGTVSDAAVLMRKNNIGGIPVVEDDFVKGIVTESDLLSLLETEGPSDDLWLPSPLEFIEIPVREFINWEKTKKALSDIGNSKVTLVMSSPVITVDADDDIEKAASIMLKEGVARLPVVENKKILGIVTRADIIRGVGKKAEMSG